MTKVTKYSTERTNQVAGFLDSVAAAGGNTEAVLDSIKNDPAVEAPAALAEMLGKVPATTKSACSTPCKWVSPVSRPSMAPLRPPTWWKLPCNKAAPPST